MKLSCVIIEDLKVAAEYLERCCEKSGHLSVMGKFPDVQSALEYLNGHRVDLLFLDVEMPGATGFDLLDQIAYKPRVVLTTSKEEYAYSAFQYDVADFLKKPFAYHRFLESVQKVKAELTPLPANTSKQDSMFIKFDGKLMRLKYENILFIESRGDYVSFITTTKKYVVPYTLANVQEKLDNQIFMRVHRSYIINLTHIDDIRENNLFINGQEIPIAKGSRPEVLKRITII